MRRSFCGIKGNRRDSGEADMMKPVIWPPSTHASEKFWVSAVIRVGMRKNQEHRFISGYKMTVCKTDKAHTFWRGRSVGE